MGGNAFGPWVAAIEALVRQGKARGWVTLDEVTTALAAPEVSAELVEDLLEALAELEIEVADESEAPALRGPFPDRLAREIGRVPGDAAADMLKVLDGLSAADSGSFRTYAGETLPW